VEGETDKHIWADSYDEEIREPEDIFRIQSQIAKSIAGQLKTIITPAEKQLLEKSPTTSLTAFELYQKGHEEYWKYWSNRKNTEALEKAENFYRNALEFDPAFAKVYTGLAWVYWYKRRWENYNLDDCLDSILILADIALNYDDQLTDAYVLRGNNYRLTGKGDQAIKEFEKALKLNPNHWQAYNDLGWLYLWNDHVKSIDNFHKALSLVHGPELPTFLRRCLCYVYDLAGFPEKSEYYNMEALKLDGDSVAYHKRSGLTQYHHGNYEKAIDALEKVLAIDSTNADILWMLGRSSMYRGHHEESLKYLKKWSIERSKSPDFSRSSDLQLGYAYWRNGFEEEAEYHFSETFKYLNKANEREGTATDSWTYYDLAAVYLYMGDNDKAYKNLQMFGKKIQYPHAPSVTAVKNDYLFKSIRDEPEYQLIIRDIEAKYQAEHERVRKWLEENEML
jgi:tetratricopeptide (TPR) repeat protein